jgi:hypothetical protein
MMMKDLLARFGFRAVGLGKITDAIRTLAAASLDVKLGGKQV